MENKVQVFFDSMCNTCQYKFKKVISVAKKNALKDLDDLQVFLCTVDKNRSIDDDNGLVPLAFIFCKKDSYVFFWKEDLYNGDGSSKIKIVNDRLILSQTTIDRIKEHNANNNELIVVKKKQTQDITSKLISENNTSIVKHFNRQMAIMNRQNLLHIIKIKKMILSIVLVIILLFATTGGVLGWYFSSRNNISNGQLPNYNWRINLAEHLKNSQLEGIADNREETILTVAKDKNPDLKIEDLYLTNISETSATILVKSSSNIYDYNSSVEVHYLSNLKTLVTDVKKVNFPKTVIEGTPEELLDIVAGSYENDYLVRSNVIIKKSEMIDGILQADLTVIKDSEVYLNDDVLKIYFSNSNRKLLSDVLTVHNLDDILNKKENTIITEIGEKNSEVNLNEIEVKADSISNSGALIQVTGNSKDYILNSVPIQVNYRVFNPNIGKVIEKTTNATHFNNATIAYGILYLDSIDKILIGTNTGLYLLNSDGTINTKINDDMGDDNDILAIGKLNDDTILVSTKRRTVWHLHKDGSTIDKINNSSIIYSFLIVDGTILAGGWNGTIFQLNQKGEIIRTVKEELESMAIGTLINLSNNTILAGGWNDSIGGKIFQLTMAGTFIKKVGDFKRGIFSIIELHDGTILATSKSENFQLNDDGTVKEQVPGFWDYGLGTVQLPNGDFFMISRSASVYKLRTE
ncbi:ligand-binding sensor domain-containing protein [Spiroplasma chrysopicola]|uniref:Uncharacterized protein n=1 Tax=Spiroplasma chrysopicola DF-1 TaxID=1276227 RepID=R4U422_9MOLU|nr:PQQ-binding-like beta-propeller repeat protein [Spiroplasma chrysopicola]AGM25298.1 hypothetical protein SCHRY_v1c07220 [Spiroplasma chrysopicola DF-1]